MSPGSSRTRSVPGSRWSRPVAGARWAAQTSAASPTASARLASAPAAGRPGQSPRRRTGRGRRRAAPGAGSPACRGGRGSPPRRRPAAGTPTPAAGPRASIVPTVRWSVGSKARSESISSPKNSIRIGQRQRRREDVDDAAPPRELAAAGDLDDRHVAELEQLAQERVLVRSGARAGARAARRAGRPGAIVCWRSAWTLATRTRAPAAPPGGQGRDPGGGLVGDELAALVGERRPRLEDGDRRRVAEPGAELLGDAVADLRVAGDPDQPLAVGREGERRGEVASWRRAGPRRGRRAGRSGAGRRRVAGPRRSRSAANVPVAASSGGSADEVREAVAGRRARRRRASRPSAATASSRRRLAVGPAPAGGRPRPRRRPRRRRSRRSGRRATARVARGELGRDPLGDPAVAAAPAAERRVRHDRCHRSGVRLGRGGSGASRSSCGGRRRRRAGRRPRRARRAGSASAGRSSNMLKRLAALFVPSRAQASTASAAASSSSSRRCCSSGAKRGQDVVDRAPVGLADPDPQPAELLGPELVDDRAQAVVAAGAAALAEAQLAERQGEVVGDDEQVDERRVLAGEHLADREARVVHEGQRLDERQVEPAVAAHRPTLTRRAAGPGRPSRPGRRAGRGPSSRRCAASPRTAMPGFPRPTTTFTTDRLRRRHGRARSLAGHGERPRDGVRRGSPAMVSRPGVRLTARAGRCSSARIAASSAGSAWSQPQTWSVPWVTRRRSSSAGDQRTSPVWPPRPCSACSIGPLDRDDDVAEVRRRPGGRAKATAGPLAVGALPGCGGNASGGSSGNDRTSVGPSLPRWVALSAGELRVVGQDQADRGRATAPRRRRAPPRSPGRAPPPGPARRRPSRTREVDPPRARVERPGHERRAGRLRRPPPAAAGATRARRPCSAGRRSAGGTCPSSWPTNASRIRSMSRSVRSHSSNWPSAIRSSMIRLTIARIAGSSRDDERAHRRLDAVGEHDQRRLAGLRLRAGVAERAAHRPRRPPSALDRLRGRRTARPRSFARA